MLKQYLLVLLSFLLLSKIYGQTRNESFVYVPFQIARSEQATVYSVGTHVNFLKLNKVTGNSKLIAFNITGGPSWMPYQDDIKFSQVKSVIEENMRGDILMEYEIGEKASSMAGSISLGAGFGIKNVSFTIGPSLYFFPTHKIDITIKSHDFEWEYGDVAEFKYVNYHFRPGIETAMTFLTGGFILKYGYYLPKESINFEPMHQFGICFGQRMRIGRRK